jgi:hypothetical protein
MINGTEQVPAPTIKWGVLGGGFALAAALTAGAMTMRLGSVPVPPIDPDRAADSLIVLWIDSVGGMETYERFETARFTLSTTLYDTLSGRVMHSRPRYVWIKRGPGAAAIRVERWETSGFIQQGFDGRATWVTQDGMLLADTTMEHRKAVDAVRDVFHWIALPFRLHDAGVRLTYLGLSSPPGTDLTARGRGPRQPSAESGYHAVSASLLWRPGLQPGTFTFYFRPGKGFPIELTFVEEGTNEIERVLWGSTARSGAIQYPYVRRLDHVTESGKLTRVLEISDFVVNLEIPQAMFQFSN